jgi:hypothetical protein
MSKQRRMAWRCTADYALPALPLLWEPVNAGCIEGERSCKRVNKGEMRSGPADV